MSDLTKSAIKNTFINLLDTRPMNQITVRMVVEECGINRNTFYYHYADLPALIEEITTEAADKIIEENPYVDTLEAVINAVMDFASLNRRSIYHIYNSVNRDIFEQHLWKVCGHVVHSYGSSIAEGSGISESDRDILERFYRCECFGVVMEWLDEGMPNDVQEKVKRFCYLHQGIEKIMIERCIEDPVNK